MLCASFVLLLCFHLLTYCSLLSILKTCFGGRGCILASLKSGCISQPVIVIGCTGTESGRVSCNPRCLRADALSVMASLRAWRNGLPSRPCHLPAFHTNCVLKDVLATTWGPKRVLCFLARPSSLPVCLRPSVLCPALPVEISPAHRLGCDVETSPMIPTQKLSLSSLKSP